MSKTHFVVGKLAGRVTEVKFKMVSHLQTKSMVSVTKCHTFILLSQSAQNNYISSTDWITLV